MVKQLTDERRKALRAKRILSIQYRLAKSKRKIVENKWYLSTTHDMSALGISFLSEVPFAADDILEIQVVMSGLIDIFKGYGKVVRIEKKNTGVFYVIAVRFVKAPAKKASTKTTAKTKRTRVVKAVKTRRK